MIMNNCEDIITGEMLKEAHNITSFCVNPLCWLAKAVNRGFPVGT